MTGFKLSLGCIFTILAPSVLSFSLNHPISHVPRPSSALFDVAQNVETVKPELDIIDSGASSNTDTLTTETSSRVSIKRPAIHWTVPGFKVGWQDENGDWFDEDGPRNGPPQNYWRQMSDEREYNRDMESANMALAQYDIDETVANLEKRRSIRRPSLHRKMLGRWAPILMSGDRVAFNDKPTDNESNIEVPYTIEISRTNGRKYGPKNYYGIFDLKISVGEELTVKVVGGGGHDVTIHESMTVADDANEPVLLGTLNDNKSLYLGGITYLTDYIMIQRDPDGKIDLWVRADESYLGVKDSSVAIGEIKVE